MMSLAQTEPRVWWSPHWRDLLALLAAISAALCLWVESVFGANPDRLLVIGSFGDGALVGLLALIATLGFTAWVIARCWVGGIPDTTSGLVARSALTVTICVLALLPTLLAGLWMGLSLDNTYTRIDAPEGNQGFILQVIDGWDADESTRVFRGGPFIYSAASSPGYTDCLNDVDKQSVKFAIHNGIPTVSADLPYRCHFTDLAVALK